MRVAFESGGRMTFGVRAKSREDVLEVAAARLAGLDGAQVEVVPVDAIGER